MKGNNRLTVWIVAWSVPCSYQVVHPLSDRKFRYQLCYLFFKFPGKTVNIESRDISTP